MSSYPQEWTPEVIAAEKAICDALWKAKGVRGDAIWPTEELRSIINAALAAEQERNKELVDLVERLRDKIKAAHGLPNFHSTEIKDIDAVLAKADYE
jgi:hypothetical protein